MGLPSLLGTSKGSGSTNASLTRYGSLTAGGYHMQGGLPTVEADAKLTTSVAGTFSQLSVYVSSNNRATSTLRFRKNGADGNMAVSMSGTGVFADLTAVDNMVAGDQWSLSLVTGAGGSSFVERTVWGIFTSATGDCVTFMGAVNSIGLSTASTVYCTLCGAEASAATTESHQQRAMRSTGTFKYLGATVRTNTWTATSTLRFRKNGADGNQVVSVATTLTGLFEDTSNTDTCADGDLFNSSFTTAAGSGTIVTWALKVEFHTPSGDAYIGTGVASGLTVSSGTTRYGPIGGPDQTDTAESSYQHRWRRAFRISRMSVYITNNSTTTGSSTWRYRGGGADVTSLSVAAGATGLFEDTSSVGVLASNDLVNFAVTAGTGGSGITFSAILAKVEVQPWRLRETLLNRAALVRAGSW